LHISAPTRLHRINAAPEQEEVVHPVKLFIGALVALACAAAPASAAIISNTYNFTASGFTTFSGSATPAAPVDPVTGSFSVTFDNTVTVDNVTSGITQNALNIALGSTLAFSYVANVDMLMIGGLQTNVSGILNGSDDFLLVINGVSTTPVFTTFGYTDAEFPDVAFLASTGSVTVGAVVAVAEPGTLALFGAALAGLGFIRRKRCAA
jgi:hypothetical protein